MCQKKSHKSIVIFTSFFGAAIAITLYALFQFNITQTILMSPDFLLFVVISFIFVMIVLELGILHHWRKNHK